MELGCWVLSFLPLFFRCSVVSDSLCVCVCVCVCVSDSLKPRGLQHTRLLCPSPSPEVCSNLCPLSRRCHPTISSSVVPFSSCPQSFPASGSFSSESALRIKWPKYWSFSFSISPSDEYSGLISFRMDWFDLLAVQGTLKILLQHHSLKAYGPFCTSFPTIFRE